jgi:hypothetical protein
MKNDTYWSLLPGVPPTGKPLEIALVGIVAFRGDKLFFEWVYTSTIFRCNLIVHSPGICKNLLDLPLVNAEE